MTRRAEVAEAGDVGERGMRMAGSTTQLRTVERGKVDGVSLVVAHKVGARRGLVVRVVALILRRRRPEEALNRRTRSRAVSPTHSTSKLAVAIRACTSDPVVTMWLGSIALMAPLTSSIQRCVRSESTCATTKLSTGSAAHLQRVA